MTKIGEKLRVVQIGPVPPPHGGVSTNMLAIHETLQRLGHESTIIDITNRKEKAAAHDVIKPHSAFGLIRILLTLDCEVVHYHIGGNFSARLALLVLYCGLLPGKKSVVTFHSGGYARSAVTQAKPMSLRGVAFRSVDHLIGVNEEMMAMFAAFGIGGGKTSLVSPFEKKLPNPAVELPAELKGYVESFCPLLLSVGALEREYNNDFLIDSMPKLLKQFPNAGLLIAGEGSMRKNLSDQVRSKSLSAKVKLIGNVEHDTILSLIEKSHVILRITDFDGDSISVKEAASLGKTVVASDNASRPAGILTIERPYNSSKLIARLRQAKEAQFRCHLEMQDGEGNAEKVVAVYRKILAK